MTEEMIARRLRELADDARATAELSGEIKRLADRVAATLRSGGTIYFCGNGGSAADAQHLATEYVVRLGRDRGPLSAVALTTDTSLLTAAANDLGFEEVFARQIQALCRPGDLVVLHSTSGKSANLLRAAEVARGEGIGTVALTGVAGGPLAELVDQAIRIPAKSSSHVQELQLAVGHIVAELVEGVVIGEWGVGSAE